MNKRIAILDGDIFVYKVATATMKEIMFDEYVVAIGDRAEAIVALSNWIEKVKTDIDADDIHIAFTGKDNFRKKIWAGYKQNRTRKKPMLVKELQDWCMQNYSCLVDAKLEADDILGQWMSESYLNKDLDYVGVSEDKDLQGVPGALFNPEKDTLIQRKDLDEAIMFFYTQVLTGDTSDGYKGVPGVGPVKAARYLGKACDESEGLYDFIDKGWRAILKLYEKNGDVNDAYINADMAKILWYGEKPIRFWVEDLKTFWRKKYER